MHAEQQEMNWRQVNISIYDISILLFQQTENKNFRQFFIKGRFIGKYAKMHTDLAMFMYPSKRGICLFLFKENLVYQPKYYPT